jgi:hypothetical protein
MNFNFYVYTIQWPKEKRTKEKWIKYLLRRVPLVKQEQPTLIHEKIRILST